MRLKLSEAPKQWRKTALLSALGLAVLSSLLHWRRVLPGAAWVAVLGILGAAALAAALAPRLFRGYYRFSQRLGFHLSRGIGYVALLLIFLLVLTPLGLLARALGKDLLRLKRPARGQSGWVPARENSPLDRLF